MTRLAAESSAREQPHVLGQIRDDAELTDQVLAPLVRRDRRWWWVAFLVCAAGTLLLLGTVLYTVITGIGVWGDTSAVAWGFAIVNFIWWSGIGHAGALISAGLLLLNQHWRGSINRIAESMAVFALLVAGIFPLLHLGRPWFFFWMMPYPNTYGVWPQFRSALTWDFVAVAADLIVAFLFWYAGLIPDLATVRDRVAGLWRRRVYGIFALGWKGSGRDWQLYRAAYGTLAALAAATVFWVHTIVSLDLAAALLPGWHSTLFPPYFVAGALHSGFATILLLLIAFRGWQGLHNEITTTHLDIVARAMLATAWLLIYAHVVEAFVAWSSGDLWERFIYLSERPFGGYAWMFWGSVITSLLVPQLLWFRRMRSSVPLLAATSLLVLIGMWLERFMIVVPPQARDFLPSNWRLYAPTWVDWGIFAGSVSLFGLLMLLLLRWVPVVRLNEVKRLRHELVHARGHG